MPLHLTLLILASLIVSPTMSRASDISVTAWLDRCFADTVPRSKSSKEKPSCLSLVLWFCEHASAPMDCRDTVKAHAVRQSYLIAQKLPKTHPAEQLDKIYQKRLSQHSNPSTLSTCDAVNTRSQVELCQVKRALSQYSLAIFLRDFTTRIYAP